MQNPQPILYERDSKLTPKRSRPFWAGHPLVVLAPVTAPLHAPACPRCGGRLVQLEERTCLPYETTPTDSGVTDYLGVACSQSARGGAPAH